MSIFEKMQEEKRKEDARIEEQSQRARLSTYAVLPINSRRYAVIKESSIDLSEPPVRFMRIMEGEDKHDYSSAQKRAQELNGGKSS
jgi:hypothetical protein